MMILVTISLIVLALVPSNLAYYKVGCYVDKPSRILEGNLTVSTTMTIQKCVKRCSDEQQYFAAVETGSHCFCGKYLKPYTKLTDNECLTQCTGDSSQVCGGIWKASVYSTEAGYVYIGCREDKNNRILEGAKETSATMTPEHCINRCKNQNKRFSLLENGNECFCGDHLKDYPKKPDSECDKACSGDNSQTCGGFWRGQLYALNNYNL